MNYSVSNTINKPLQEVAQKFDDSEGLKNWMEGFQKLVHISGTISTSSIRKEKW